MERALKSNYFQLLIFIITVIALFGDDFVRWLLPPSVDTVLHWLLTAIFIVFVLEAVVQSLVNKGE